MGTVMGMTCAKCGSSEILPDVPIVSNVDNFSAVPVSGLAYRKPDARVFRGPVPHRLLARVCGACGFTELYIEDPKGFAAIFQPGVDDA
jgi:predicted nucleic-acid-binding Zn-ribbon protein